MVIVATLLMAAAPGASAALVQFTFSISGDNGESGSGRFVWDDAVVANGSAVANSVTDTGNLLSVDISISGGNVIGGTTSFTLADCVGAFLLDAADFTTDINFFCNNSVNSLSGRVAFTNYLNDTADMGAGSTPPVLGPSSSTLTFTPGIASRVGSGANVIPANPWWSLMLTTGLLALMASRQMQRRGNC